MNMKRLKMAVIALGICLVGAWLVAAPTTRTVTLSWDPSTDPVTFYTVYQATALTGPYLPIAQQPGTNLTLNVTPGSYTWYVTATATNFWGTFESGPSNMLTVPPPNPPAQPIRLQIKLTP